MSKKIIIRISLPILLIAAAFIGLNGPTFIAGATAPRLQEPANCSTQGTSATELATTSISYMTPGTGTSTATCNMANAGEGTEVFDFATLAIQFTGSSTASSINIDIEHSQDGIDWYKDTVRVIDASTTPSSFGLDNTTSYSLAFSSSTVGGGAGTSDITTRVIDVPAVAKYVRAVFSIPAGSQNGAIWGNFVGKTQQK